MFHNLNYSFQAETRLAARRQARYEARNIRLKEIEKKKEEEENQANHTNHNHVQHPGEFFFISLDNAGQTITMLMVTELADRQKCKFATMNE
jgi:hypothetical protein